MYKAVIKTGYILAYPIAGAASLVFGVFLVGMAGYLSLEDAYNKRIKDSTANSKKETQDRERRRESKLLDRI